MGNPGVFGYVLDLGSVQTCRWVSTQHQGEWIESSRECFMVCRQRKRSTKKSLHAVCLLFGSCLRLGKLQLMDSSARCNAKVGLPRWQTSKQTWVQPRRSWRSLEWKGRPLWAWVIWDSLIPWNIRILTQQIAWNWHDGVFASRYSCAHVRTLGDVVGIE